MRRASRRARAAWLAGAGALALAGASVAVAEGAGYVHQRGDYFAFRASHGELLEPNYLPFMAYPVEAPPRGWLEALRRELPSWLGGAPGELWLVFCRWEPSDLPLRVFIEPPVIPEDLDEFRPRQADEYVDAVGRALALWEESLEGRLSFTRVERAEDATLHLRLVGELAPLAGSELQVLGSASLAEACQATGGDPASGRLEVRYRVSALRIYVADVHGLLLPDQVEKVALHELGHALGMAGHSPVPADLMYEVARDRLGPDGLGAEDVNSFLSLYALPNGVVYRRLSEGVVPPTEPAPPPDPPVLALAPHVDPRLGFEIQPPRGWMRLETPFGFIAVDGVTWDYDASLQIVVRRFDTLEEYLERYGRAHLGRSRVLTMSDVRVAGRRAKRVVLATPRDTVEELTFVESGDGRVLIAIAECPAERHDAYAPWFEATLASLEIADRSRDPSDRDYRERARGDVRPR